MSNLVTIIIDHMPYQFPKDLTILQAAETLGMTIPTLCHDPILKPYTSCWVCVVEVKNGRGGLVPACSTIITDGMELEFDNERITKTRQAALELLLSDHFGDCYAPCRYKGCPANIDIQGFLALEADGRYLEAAALIREKAPLPNILGRVCPRPCEAVCRRHRVDEPVAIGIQKRFIAEKEHQAGGPFLPECPALAPNCKNVAIIGAGSAGITAAYYLRLAGIGVTLYEKHDKHGGMLRYGIPDYRLPQDIIDIEFNAILSRMNIEIHYHREIGKDLSFHDLEQQYDAVLLSVGAQDSARMNIVGEDVTGVVSGISFLQDTANRHPLSLKDKRVLVVGGGNTAMDAARSALRLGASVCVLYRRSQAEMLANPIEVHEAIEEGVDFKFLVNPVRIEQAAAGTLQVVCTQMILAEPDSNGRRQSVPMDHSDFLLQADYVMSAIGQKINVSFLPSNLLDIHGKIMVNKGYQSTVNPKVFVAGDCLFGPSLVVTAVAQARKTAASMSQYLAGQPITGEAPLFSSYTGDLKDLPSDMFAAYKKEPRQPIFLLGLKERQTTFNELEQSASELSMKSEAERCLSCGCEAVKRCDLKQHSEDYHASQDVYQGERRAFSKDYSHPMITLESDKCINCSACIQVCDDVKKYHIFGAVGRGFSTRVLPEFKKNLADTACDGCGKCVDVCPTAGVHYRVKPLRVQ